MTKRHKTLPSLTGHSRFAACEIVILPLCVSFKLQLLPNLCSIQAPRLVHTILSIYILVADVVCRFSSFSPSAPSSSSTNRSLSPGFLQIFHNHEFSPINLERVFFRNLSLSLSPSISCGAEFVDKWLNISLSLSLSNSKSLPTCSFLHRQLSRPHQRYADLRC